MYHIFKIFYNDYIKFQIIFNLEIKNISFSNPLNNKSQPIVVNYFNPSLYFLSYLFRNMHLHEAHIKKTSRISLFVPIKRAI